MPPAVTGETMPAASPTRSARSVATGLHDSAARDGAGPDRRRFTTAHIGHARNFVEKFFHDTFHGFRIARHAAGQANLRDAHAGHHPTDVAGGEFAVEEAVQAVIICEGYCGEFVLHAEQEFLILPEREGLGHLRVWSVGPDQITGVAQAVEMIAVAGFRCARERSAARKFGSRLLCLGREPANDVGRIGREKVVAGRIEIDVPHVGRVKPNARYVPDEFRRQGIEEGDLVDDLFDDDSSGMQPLARIVLTF